MDWSVWVMFVLTEGALIVTPGPAVLFVVSQSLRCGPTGALWPAAGILAANALYFAISGTGVGALLVASGSLFAVIRWAGAGYLLYRGALAILRPLPLHGAGMTADGADSGQRALVDQEMLPGGLVLRGLVLQLSNPKALLFFMAILPQFIDRGRPVVVQLVVLGVTSIGLEFLVLATYGAAAAKAAGMVMRPRFAAATSRLSGALLVGAALGMAWLGG